MGKSISYAKLIKTLKPSIVNNLYDQIKGAAKKKDYEISVPRPYL